GWLVVIHPDYATYDAERGLIVGRAGTPPPVKYRKRPTFERYSYQLEEYPEHIHWVRSAGQRRDGDYAVAARRLAKLLEVEESTLAEWLDLVYRLHDVGKLARDWHAAAWKWQVQKTGPCAVQPFLAHTDYDPDKDQHLSTIA